ncbi:unnamed protein product [Nippostrongylus brasiliensis]|uniref:Uncharacterized protein n=1 Tax=Nippostrongylus brasiliensis TaxID=27835 RepID=A0A0N4YHF8_NIPBR|nr:hypothetical protein Q1695_016263 [Nippostrongylus brasiliensis]VDL79891.1 unnamed protein product [Nippostrongylus brasiliensis]
MFSEQYGRKEADMNKKKNSSKDEPEELKFDGLEEKLSKEFSDMSTKDKDKSNRKDSKGQMKYSSAVQAERMNALGRAGKTKSATSIVRKEKQLMAENRSNSLEKATDGEKVSLGLFDAANVMCTIVDISKDSTMRRHQTDVHPAANHPKPVKTGSKSSISSTSSHSGPFASMKESEKKKKKSFDEEEN